MPLLWQHHSIMYILYGHEGGERAAISLISTKQLKPIKSVLNLSTNSPTQHNYWNKIIKVYFKLLLLEIKLIKKL